MAAKVLIVGSDPTLFAEGSPARLRLKSYAEGLGGLHVLSRGASDVPVVTDGPLTLHRAPGGRLGTIFLLPGAVRALVKKEGITLVSAQDPFEHGRAALKGIKGTGAKLHVQVHTDFLSPWYVRHGNYRSLKAHVPFMNHVRRRMADRVLPNACGVRVVSERVKASLVEKYKDRIPAPVVIPLPVSADLPPPVPFPQHPFPFAFVTTGRLEPEKRIEDILMALGRLGPRMHGVGLFVIGEGGERARLERLARKLGLATRVVFLGWRTDASALMRSGHAYIQASAYEGYGVALIEAALARLPIITTDVGIVGEVFRGYEDVLSVPPADPANLAAMMNRLIGDHQLRKELAMNAEAKAKAHLASAAGGTARIVEDLRAHLS